MLVLMLVSMLMSHASVDLFVLSFVLPRAYAYEQLGNLPPLCKNVAGG